MFSQLRSPIGTFRGLLIGAVISLAALSPGAATPEAGLATPDAPPASLSAGDLSLLKTDHVGGQPLQCTSVLAKLGA